MLEKLVQVGITLFIASVAIQLILCVLQPYLHLLGLTLAIALVVLVAVASLLAIRWLLKQGIGERGGRYHS